MQVDENLTAWVCGSLCQKQHSIVISNVDDPQHRGDKGLIRHCPLNVESSCTRAVDDAIA